MGSISVFEHYVLLVGTVQKKGGFEQKHFNSLADRLGKKDDDAFPFYSLVKYQRIDGIKFKQYVGAIQVGDLTIEILPKTDKDEKKNKEEDFEKNEERWRGVLLDMLRAIYNLQVRSQSNAPQHLRHSSVLDFVIYRFLDETETLLHQGLVKTYRKLNENSTALKGKLLILQQVTRNLVHQEKFYVRHTMFDRSHIMNRILRQTLVCLCNYSKNPSIYQRAKTYLTCFPELDPVTVNENLFARLIFDRKTTRYRDAISLAELILINNMPDLQSGGKDTLALLFDMNRLWEQFVFVSIRRHLAGKYLVRDQVRHGFWETKIIRPDIVVSNLYDQDDVEVILDTKWKQPAKGIPSDSDLHQMYVYFKYFGAKKVALLYPGSTQLNSDSSDNDYTPVRGKFTDDSGASCDLFYLPVPDESKNVKLWQKQIGGAVEKWLLAH